MPLILGTNSIKDTGYDVANSLRFNSGSSDNLSRSPSGASNRKTFTLSWWVKRSKLGSRQSIFNNTDGSGQDGVYFDFYADDTLALFDYGTGSYGTPRFETTQVFRDVSSWYHIIYAVDTTQSTESNRVKIYVNGSQVTDFDVANYPSQNADTLWNRSDTIYIGTYTAGGNYFGGYLAEVVNIDGSQLAPTDFGEFDSDSPTIWKPIDVSGLTFGTNGFYLDFENASSLGADVSGNSNNFTVNNLTSVDQSTDTCTNNFATMNSLAVPPSNAPTFAEGNTKVSTNNSNANPVLSTIGVSQGKWYVECKRISFDSGSADDGFRIGLGVTYVQNVNLVPAAIADSGHYFMIGTGTVYNGSTDLGDKAGDSNISDNGVVGIALDLDNNRISWSFNGAWMTGSNAWSGSSPSSYVTIESGKTYFFLQTDGSTGRGYTAGWNFGGTSAFAISSGNTDANGFGNFETAPPSGYFSLCSSNLAEFG